MSINVKEKIDKRENDEKFSLGRILTALGSFLGGSGKASKDKKDINGLVEEIEKAEDSERIKTLKRGLEQHEEKAKKDKKESARDNVTKFQTNPKTRVSSKENTEKGIDNKGYDRID